LAVVYQQLEMARNGAQNESETKKKTLPRIHTKWQQSDLFFNWLLFSLNISKNTITKRAVEPGDDDDDDKRDG